MKHYPIAAAVLILVIAGMAVFTACGGAPARKGPISPTWLKPALNEATVSLSLGDIEKYTMTHFRVSMPLENKNFDLPFMAYKLGDQVYARANVCVPCGSESFTLDGDKLVCDSCGTIFDAGTGAGRSGVAACQSYPKAAVPLSLQQGKEVRSGLAVWDSLTHEGYFAFLSG